MRSCRGDCDTAHFRCTRDCDRDDFACKSKCNRELDECVKRCDGEGIHLLIFEPSSGICKSYKILSAEAHRNSDEKKFDL